MTVTAHERRTCPGAYRSRLVVTHFRVMAFFTALTEAIASRQSLFVAGLDPNPEMLCHWASSRNLSGRSLLSQARAWCKEVIEATADHVCAYKPSLGLYQAMGPRDWSC